MGIARKQISASFPAMAPDNAPSNPINYGLRFFAASVLLISTYFALRSVFVVPKFERLFSEMLDGAELPVVTQFLIRFYPSCAVIPLAIMTLGCAVLFVSKRPQFPYYLGGCCLLLQTAVSIVYFNGLLAPLVHIISAMNGH